MRRLALVLTPALALAAGEDDLPFRPSPVPGGVAVVRLGAHRTAPRAAFRGEPVLVRRRGPGWVAVVGLPLSTKPGVAELQVEGRAVSFTVKPKRYPEQRVQLKDARKVTPSPEDEVRITEEQRRIGPAWKARPEGLVPDLSFRRPTPGDLTASFGLRRIFNGQPRAPHAGLDIRAPQGQAVRAPAPGVVVLTGDFFFSGKAVFIAHGEGVVSLLCHLSKVAVAEGQSLKEGDLVGEVGMTGRASGPHLHWSLSLNDARVDPRMFLGGAP